MQVHPNPILITGTDKRDGDVVKVARDDCYANVQRNQDVHTARRQAWNVRYLSELRRPDGSMTWTLYSALSDRKAQKNGGRCVSSTFSRLI
jgi:hypothetical protein